MLEHLDYVGVLALELFVIGDQLLANEFAPRVHNSGHWTIEGAVTSQFENHVRAILGLPLGSTRAIGHAGMVNFIGQLRQQSCFSRQRLFHHHGEVGPGIRIKRIQCRDTGLEFIRTNTGFCAAWPPNICQGLKLAASGYDGDVVGRSRPHGKS